MTDLLTRIEQAASGSRELDAEIAAEVRFFPKGVGYVWQASLIPNSPSVGRVECCTGLGTGGPHYAAPAYSTSLDAATSLMPSGTMYRSGHDGAGPDPSLFFCEAITDAPACHLVRSVAATEELARAAAALRAKEVNRG